MEINYHHNENEKHHYPIQIGPSSRTLIFDTTNLFYESSSLQSQQVYFIKYYFRTKIHPQIRDKPKHKLFVKLLLRHWYRVCDDCTSYAAQPTLAISVCYPTLSPLIS